MTNTTGYLIVRRTAMVAAVFSLVVAAVLLYDYNRRMKDPFEAPAYLALKAALRQQPESKVLQQQIQALDERLREEYFRQQTLTMVGSLLLLAGLVVFVVAAKAAATLGRKLPMPEPLAAPQDADAQWTPVARWTVAGLIVLLCAAAIGLSHSYRSPLPEELADHVGVPASAGGDGQNRLKAGLQQKAIPQKQLYTPTDADIRAAWSRFRGPDGSGISPYTNMPDTWDGPSGKNILWNTPVPLPGNNSPIVCGKWAFLSGANNKRRQVYCFDTSDGKLLWQQDVPGTPESNKPFKQEGAGYASPTMATDGRRAYAIFANGDVAAFDYEGNMVWSRSLGIPENPYGHAASLATYENLLIVPMDQATDEAGKSKYLALDTSTGKTVWEQKRPLPASWTTPLVIHQPGGDQLITTADPWVIVYDARQGTEIWRAKGLSGQTAPSPVFAGGVIYAADEGHWLLAIRPDGKGDVTASHILWKGEDNVPDTCSPLATEQFVFVLTSAGMFTCYDAKPGTAPVAEKLWEEDLGEREYLSSPSMVGNRVYLLRADGKCFFAEPSRQGCKRVGEANLGEKCSTSPAFQDGRMYLRGEKNLYCIGKK